MYATCMAAMIIKAIYYTVKCDKYKIKKVIYSGRNSIILDRVL